MNPNVPVYRLDLTEEEKGIIVQLLNHTNLGSFQGETTQIVNMYSAIFQKVQSAPTIASLEAPPSNVVPMVAPVAAVPETEAPPEAPGV